MSFRDAKSTVEVENLRRDSKAKKVVYSLLMGSI